MSQGWSQPTLPPSRPGQSIGLFGGSFDPPHGGHAHIARTALTRLQLDQLWWLPSPQNPLKRHNPAPMADRAAAIEALIQGDRRQTVCRIEERLPTTASIDTLAALQHLRPGLRFVWVMGADNLAMLHRWHRWQDILLSVPVAAFARPGHRLAARCSPAAKRFRQAQLADRHAALLAKQPAPAWALINLPMRADSSTALRQQKSSLDWSGVQR